ncbi:glycosyltransferase [Algibacillus agarilyticus]|uniref:glycosyltransferase n=1 Tax=Algibacillus agarilyticus TaxID=2234133 RepID=UPI000DCF9D1F|nr:glycosyltransferase [Algibacillus agarilyticus]
MLELNASNKKIKILLVIPTDFESKESNGGIRVFKNHVEELSNNQNIDLTLMQPKSQSFSLKKKELYHVGISTPFMFGQINKLIKLINYLINRLPYDVFARLPSAKNGIDINLNDYEYIIVDHIYSFGLLKGDIGQYKSKCYYISHNIETKICVEREDKAINFFERFFYKFDTWLMSKFEKVILNSIDNIIWLSEVDLLAAPDLPKSRYFIPEMLPVRNSRWRYSNSKYVVFLGGLNYFPNYDAMEWVCSYLAEELKNIGVEVFHVGKSEGYLNNLKSDNVNFKGFVSDDDLQNILNNSICLISPIELGSGVKVKVLEAVCRGVPVVASEQSFYGIKHTSASYILKQRDEVHWSGVIKDVMNKRDELEIAYDEYEKCYNNRLTISKLIGC